MLTIVVCVGSSCYVRGSDQVAEAFERLLKLEGLEGQVELAGSFCMDACSMGVSVHVNDQTFRGVSPTTAVKLFYDQILPGIAKT